VLPPREYIGAVESIPSVARYVEELQASGAVYAVDGDLYFRVASDPSFGSVARLDREQMIATFAERGGDPERPGKEDPLDCLVWQLARPDEPAWDTPLGHGRPGWHIECAAMAMSLLGEQSDIHVGGVDLVFPHHENEIAICQAATGKPPARYWIHSGLVTVGGRKMSRSSGNAIFVGDVLERGYTGRQLRYYLLSQHYRQPFNFSYPGLDAACGSLQRIDDCVRKLRTVGGGKAHPEMARLVAEFEAGFREALYDDLNVAVAGATVLHLVRGTNRRLDSGQVGEPDAGAVLGALGEADAVLGVLAPDDLPTPNDTVAALVADREAARQAQDFVRADELRARIEAEGYSLEDTPRGPQVRPRRGA
jgi:cysteinyl-tRNA synthetase